MIEVEQTCPACNNPLSSHEDGHHPPYLDLVTLADSCFMCKRSDPIKYGTYVRVSLMDGSVVEICDSCMEKADEGDDLDEELDLNPEGDPTRNGAF